MANPYLTLGGIAIGIITAGFGVLAVPGWLASAQDAAVINDLSHVRELQGVEQAKTGKYAASLEALQQNQADASLTLSDSVQSLYAVGLDHAWCGIAQSGSGRFFAASNTSSQIGSGDSEGEALGNITCELVEGGGAPPPEAPYKPVPEVNTAFQGGVSGFRGDKVATNVLHGVWTSHGLYAIGLNSRLPVQVNADGTVQELNIDYPFGAGYTSVGTLSNITTDGVNLYYADSQRRIWKVNPDGRAEVYYKATGPGGDVCSLTWDNTTNALHFTMYGWDYGFSVNRVNPGETPTATRIREFARSDGAQFGSGIALDSAGGIYLPSNSGSSILRFDPTGPGTHLNIGSFPGQLQQSLDGSIYAVDGQAGGAWEITGTGATRMQVPGGNDMGIVLLGKDTSGNMYVLNDQYRFRADTPLLSVLSPSGVATSVPWIGQYLS